VSQQQHIVVSDRFIEYIRDHLQDDPDYERVMPGLVAASQQRVIDRINEFWRNR